MALTPGSRLDPYEVTAAIGEGGMGQVFRARDTKLNRDVALKVLPDSFASDPERLARFTREAQTLASLNHPNIAHIHGLEESGGVRALVMELVEGDDLSQRIARGAIPIDEALPIAKQIAEALEAAHEQGIVHRDLKPANIKVRPDGTVKVLDFGLAKAMEPAAGSSPSMSMAPTITTPALMTGAGMILGTAAYMAPEQARGKPVDRRVDVWAFGCVLFEMLSGKQAFAGETVSDIIAAILTGEPEWTVMPATTPAPLVKLLRRCLEKDRKRRLRDIGDALHELDEALVPGAAIRPAGSDAMSAVRPPPAATRWLRPALALAGVVIACALAGVFAWRMKPAPAVTVTRFVLTLPPDRQFTGTLGRMFELSGDGTRLVYVANNRLYARATSESDARPIAGTDALVVRSVVTFAVSPDGQSIAYLSDGALKKIPLNGGAATTICPLDTASGLTWGPAGILFVAPGGIMRVSPDGGTPERIAAVADKMESVQGPQMLPDGHTLLYSVADAAGDVSRWDKADIVVQSVPGGERRTVIHGGSNARYVATGHLVYAVGGNLLAVPFDAATQQVALAPVAVLEGVRRALSTQIAQFSISDTGSLVYVPGPAGQAVSRRYQLVAVSFDGEARALPVPDGPYEFPRFSPDGTRIAFDTDDGTDANIWVYELSGARAMRRLTFGGRNRHPVWSRDGRWITFQSDRQGDLGLFRQQADGTGAAERLTKADAKTAHVPQSWSPSGEYLLYTLNKGGVLGEWTGAQNPGMSSTLELLALKDLKTTAFAVVQTSDRAVNAEFSPDGAWVAYDSGNRPTAVYAQPFPPTGAVYQLSKDDDGHHPWWSHDGRELFYVPGPDGLVRVSVTTRPSFSVGGPTAIPRGRFIEAPVTSRNIDTSPDGKTIIGVAAAGQVASSNANVSEMQVVLNWLEELKRLVPKK